ncbi:MAG: hypothetical protein ACRYGK_12020 [Janthinobacterium lividum]
MKTDPACFSRYCFQRLSVFLLLAACCLAPSRIRAEDDLVTKGPSYDERWRIYKRGGGTKQLDPNVYVYTSEFARRFKMPEEWVSDELKGVDAVAFRVKPDYPTCGWGGDPKACRFDEVRCEMDLYFDKRRNPLPWDADYPEVQSHQYANSSHFIPAPHRSARNKARPNENSFTTYSPFVNPKSGNGMAWHGSTLHRWARIAVGDG